MLRAFCFCGEPVGFVEWLDGEFSYLGNEDSEYCGIASVIDKIVIKTEAQ